MYQWLILTLLFCSLGVRAQDKRALDSTDKVIINSIIRPAEQSAGNQEPNWTAIEAQVKASYSEVQCDRAITKARIYHYYGRDWAKFSNALVHYTEAYEDKSDAALMNKNARMVLDHSENLAEWRTALDWIRHALDKDPENSACKATKAALEARINGH